MLNATKDTLPLVRVGASEVLYFTVQHLSKDMIKGKVLPTLQEALKNEENDEVKVEIVNAFKQCGLVIGHEFFNIVSQIDIGKLMMEANWRVRQATLRMITELAEGFKAIELFEVHLQEFFFRYLDDKIHSIRVYGNEQLERILKIESANWAISTLIPKIEQYLVKDMSYQKKMSAMKALSSIVKNFTGNTRSKALSLILLGCKDDVPNVRMMSIIICQEIYSNLESQEQSSIRSSISSLAGDSDKDVKDFAKKFIQTSGH